MIRFQNELIIIASIFYQYLWDISIYSVYLEK